MSVSAESQAEAGAIGDLVLQLTQLREHVAHAAECADLKLCQLAAGRRHSLENLQAYVALREGDLRTLQDALRRLGLGSLHHAEPHVLATLDSLLNSLALMSGQLPGRPVARDAFDRGATLLRRNTERLFGAPPAQRRARIMITLPDEAADDPQLLQALLIGGMDCARINCAYGDQASWAKVIRQLREAESATGRSCRVFMDLRGPKLRTGHMELEPAVLKLRPTRADDGKVLRPARLRLTATAQQQSAATPAGVSLVVDKGWLRQAAPGLRIRLRDARGSNRTWRIVECDAEGCWAESRKTTYFVNGTVLRLQQRKGQDLAVTTLNSLPPRESRITIRPGDILYLSSSQDPGKPPVHNLEGQLLEPGTIPLAVPEVFRDARVGQPIRFDDGHISGVIEQAGGGQLKVRIGHTRRPVELLTSDKGINLPETDLDLPALSTEDLNDLDFVARNADIIGLSFTNTPADVRTLHQQLSELGREEVGLIYKIETRRGCNNLPGILLEAMKLSNFGVLIARGDLAAECGFENLAELQEDILRVCEAAHVPAIWATGVLDGLARRGHPVRAEMTDAAMAQRAECVMLGKGRYIVQALGTLDQLLSRMQRREYKQRPLLGELLFEPAPSRPKSE